MKKEYRIEIEDNVIVLVNTQTEAEGGRFDSQAEAVERIKEMALKKHISANHALSLFEVIRLSDIVFDTLTSISPIDAVAEGVSKILDVERIHHLLLEMKKAQSRDRPYFWVCEECKNHGVIYIPNGRSHSLRSKVTALSVLQEMYDNDIVNLIEKEEIQKSIEESTLPVIEPAIAMRLN